MNEQQKKTLVALSKNRMGVHFCETAAEIPALVRSLLKKGDRVAVGGSVTLEQTGVLKMLYEPEYRMIDRYETGITPAGKKQRFREAFFADVFLTSSNAVTESGELVNVDGNGNRVAAMMYGPDRVIVIVGSNKIVPTAQDGFRRIRRVAAPKNAERLNCRTYCREAGQCMATATGMTAFTAGCLSPDRICCQYTVMGRQREEGRIQVILCGESLGY